MRLVLLVLLFSLSGVAIAEQGEQVSTAAYLKRIGDENNIEMVGLSLVSGETFVPSSRKKDVEKILAKALSRYNYIVNYGDHRITRVVVLGKKGTSVGPLPDDEPPPPTPSVEEINQ
ncbi:MAG: hypothetical protein KDI19_11745 [Pseudomonadales bacterium]|nr:hypothetical protein [Pseudomonadales bacterium]